MKLDRADKKILRAVQQDCMIGAEALGELCGMSSSTALRRLKRLRAEGVITAEVALVDPRKVGSPLQLIVGVRLEKDDARVAREFADQMKLCPSVMQCYFVTGSADYILHLATRDMDEYNEFVQEKLVANPYVAMTETNVVISSTKVGLRVPIAD